MKTLHLELADVVREHASAYLARYGQATFPEQRRVLRDIVACRTATLGGHVKKCDQCGHTEVFYDSCRNRHCPKCQAAARAEWMKARAEDLLETVEYYHCVFTLDDHLRDVALQNKRVVYNLLFRSVSETLKTIARDPKHLGADIGFLGILHTWGQTIRHHPHIHCVIPGGGLSPDGQRWIPCRNGFFLPVRVLSCLFQKKFLFHLNEARQQGKLSLHGQLKRLADENHWRSFLTSLYNSKWVVYAKPPFGGAKQVLKYLARYTHRVAISNQRLIALEHGKVRFRWKDYANGNRQRTMTLDAVEFLRRFLLHVLPRRFMRIRYYGFLANRHRKEKVALCRKLLGLPEETSTSTSETPEETTEESTDSESSTLCPVCKKGRMLEIETLRPDPTGALKLASFLAHDTS
jgi:hypothetical protein